MKGKLYLLALSAMALVTGCTNDETTEVIDNSAAIKFSAVANSSTRGTATTTSSIDAFKTYAYYDDGASSSTSVFMDGITVSKVDNKWSTASTYFWPESGSLDFYSISPTAYSITKGESAYTIDAFTVASEVDNQVDLLYAVNLGETKANHESSAVSINFRHALSQIVFAAKNTNSNLKVEIASVSVVNVQNGGTYTYPTAATTTQLDADNGSTSAVSGSQGSWTLSDDKTNFAVALSSAVSLAGSSTATATALTSSTSKALFLLPQTQSAWDVTNDAKNEKGYSYFLISCKIWNVSGTTETLIWSDGNGGYADVAIPVAIAWNEGYKYTYTFIFGQGGGYVPPTPNPDPDDPDQPGDPVLVPVTFDITVDEFQSANNDVDMSTTTTSGTTEGE
ncbi:MAG: fimbrillin family protein [Bacteroides sp.]|nr:fimbrillin family protein [Bacteroides sp.]